MHYIFDNTKNVLSYLYISTSFIFVNYRYQIISFMIIYSALLSFLSKGDLFNMAYISYSLKKEYKKETNAQRTKNLKRLREIIAKLSLSDFATETGITKNDLSMLENGEKTLSLFHIQAYKKFFLEKYTINLSVDYIMGYTDIMENNNLNYQREVGLSSDAINTLKIFKKSYNELLDVTNSLFSDKDKAIALFSNIRIIISDDTWHPCIAHYINDSAEQVKYEDINIPNRLGFYCDNYGVLLIDEGILKSHSLLNIQEILESYKRNDD